MQARESAAAAEARWEKLRLVQDAYPEFIPFLVDVMDELGFDVTELQEDIADYIAHGPKHLMVQAQRGQAKTTIAAGFAVFDLIHQPHHRVLVLSAGGVQASEISTLIVRIIMTMDVLECMRPDKGAGDKASVEHFDVHHSLKGLDKSPSVACVGITANLQGKRADILISDDIESSKNGLTQIQRAALAHLTKDFASICTDGRIIWLGTPQSMDSLYNQLPARGVEIRIWPGRYPTADQLKNYGDMLAPHLRDALEASPELGTGGGLMGDQGQPTDSRINETLLQEKELSQGAAYFQLQHMLNTALTDEARYPLKPELLVLLENIDRVVPLTVVRGMTTSTLRNFVTADYPFRVQTPHTVSSDVSEFAEVVAYIDPAAGGANADETAYAIGGFINSTVSVLEVGGLPGGYDLIKLEQLAKRLALYSPTKVVIEKNMGFGAFREVFAPILRKHIKCDVQDDLVSGMKETRIINTLAPVMGRGSLIITKNVIEQDERDIARYAAENRKSYSLFWQLSKMTATRGAVTHDDRVDALEGLVRYFQPMFVIDQDKKVAELAKKAHAKLMHDPLGYLRTNYNGPSLRSGGMKPNYLRKKKRR